MLMAVIAPSSAGVVTCTSEVSGTNMQRSASSSAPPSEGSFWTTIELLAGRDRRRSAGDAECTIELPPRSNSALSFAHPHVRARLEKHMGSNLVSLTDKSYMNDLEDRIRELDEMERLKRLILVGKTPLKECPPELYHHPVFVFWRMVNKEVARASKKRADAFYRKLKASQKNDQSMDEEGELEDEEEEHEALTPEQMIAKCRQELDEQAAVDVERGVRFTDDQFALIKYETNDVKTLKTLTTVEELYSLADKIIGTKRI
ncbi:hypothetical protein MSG28_002085 [Choristoneura fumiferana]|uniref:Uncharacterized protein n=1 Tax=Choristoneura fumiferana TaxID=7141 RepID=A0ACC0JU73_CHOFU|nr:hypothetical protein MSG28_002085 [Choristoneura fumiferana]